MKHKEWNHSSISTATYTSTASSLSELLCFHEDSSVLHLVHVVLDVFAFALVLAAIEEAVPLHESLVPGVSTAPTSLNAIVVAVAHFKVLLLVI